MLGAHRLGDVWYNSRMETKMSSSVADLSDDQRKLLESLIGKPLSAEEVVYGSSG